MQIYAVASPGFVEARGKACQSTVQTGKLDKSVMGVVDDEPFEMYVEPEWL